MTEEWLIAAIAAPLIYFTLVAIGRLLKNRAGVRLGLLYQLFAIVVGCFVPLSLLDASPALRDALLAAVVLLGTIFGLALLRRFFWEGYLKRRGHAQIPKFITEVVALIIFLVAVAMVLGIVYGLRIPTGVLAGSGIVAVIVGFAMQDTLGNIVAGFALNFEKPYKVGDWLVIDAHHAEVMEINWRSTRLRTNDDVYLDIPNNHLARQSLINLTYPNDLHAMRLPIAIEYKAAPNAVKEALQRATLGATGVLPQPAPKIFLKDFSDFAVIYEIKFWMDNHKSYNEITDAIRTNVWYELRRAGIKIPFPIRTVRLERKSTFPPENNARLLRDLLRQQSVFEPLAEDELERVVAQARTSQFGRGEKIIQQDSHGESMFVLLEGTARVVVNNDGALTQVATLRGGDCFGEMSLLTGEARSATVLAVSDCKVVEVDKKTLGGILKENPDLLRHLSELLAQRHLETEGVLAGARKAPVAVNQREYAAGFIRKLRSLFEL